MNQSELDEIVAQLRQRSNEYSGDKDESYFAGYAAGLLRALQIIEESE